MSRVLLAALAARPSFADFNLSAGEPITVGRIRIELLAGLTVALALVPEAVAADIHLRAYQIVLDPVCRLRPEKSMPSSA